MHHRRLVRILIAAASGLFLTLGAVVVWLMIAGVPQECFALPSYEASTPETYAADVARDRGRSAFGAPRPVGATMYFQTEVGKGFGLPSRLPLDLDEPGLRQVIAILDAPDNYEWAETGTPFFARAIQFADAGGHCIGFTVIDVETGQTYTSPGAKRMKWGHLTNKALARLGRLLGFDVRT